MRSPRAALRCVRKRRQINVAIGFIEQVETKVGNVTTVTTFAEFGDWNGSDYLSDVMFPKRIVQKRGAETLVDLTVTKTNTYNPYVIMPVPPTIKAGAATAR